MRRALALALIGCGAATPAAEPATSSDVGQRTPNNVGHYNAPYVELPVSLWAETTYSPQAPSLPLEPREAALLEACGHSDAALARTAKEAPPEVEPILRALGSPAVRPRVITVNGTASDGALKKRLTELRTPNTRCGLFTSGDVTTIVSAEHLADLDPLPVRSRTGTWHTLDATLNVPATSAKVLVLGPRGAPKTYPTTIDTKSGLRRVHARFALDSPGEFTVQVLADVEGGPRPLLEARMFADVPPSQLLQRAPGENESSLELMVAAVRTEESLGKLVRDPRLDALAAAHVERMKTSGRVAHDVGDGDLAERFQAEGYVAAVIGENVAKGETLALAHRALYASPSHRANLMNAQYTRLGVASSSDGPRVWVCEVFSSDLR